MKYTNIIHTHTYMHTYKYIFTQIKIHLKRVLVELDELDHTFQYVQKIARVYPTKYKISIKTFFCSHEIKMQFIHGEFIMHFQKFYNLFEVSRNKNCNDSLNYTAKSTKRWIDTHKLRRPDTYGSWAQQLDHHKNKNWREQ